MCGEFDKRARERSLGVWASLHRWLLAIGILGVTDFMQPVASGTGPGMKRSEILPDDWRRYSRTLLGSNCSSVMSTTAFLVEYAKSEE